MLAGHHEGLQPLQISLSQQLSTILLDSSGVVHHRPLSYKQTENTGMVYVCGTTSAVFSDFEALLQLFTVAQQCFNRNFFLKYSVGFRVMI